MDVMDSLKQFVDAWCQQENTIQHNTQAVRQWEHEIRWLENELATKKLSARCRSEYRHQIRHKELEIAFREFNGTIQHRTNPQSGSAAGS